MQKSIMEELDAIESKIQEIYYLGQFEEAQKFEQRLDSIREKYMDNLNNNYIFLYGELSATIVEQGELEYDINRFFIEKGTRLKEEQARDRYNRKTGQIELSISSKKTEELWEDLIKISNEWNKYKHNEIEEQEGIEKITKVVLKIFEEQAKRR